MEDYGLTNFPQGDRFEALKALSNDIYDFQRATNYKAVFQEGLDERIAEVFGLPLAPYTTSIEAAFNLRDHALAGPDYVNVDFREYNLDSGAYVICDIKTENGESGDRAATRATALAIAVVKFVHGQWEVNQ